MKIVYYLYFSILLSSPLYAQKQVQATDSFMFVLPGDSILITGDSILKSSIQNLPDVKITNHYGELKKILTQVKGVPVKTFISRQPIVEKPKEFSEFYYIFSAGDGYKNVYSWNELYNTSVGDSVYIITSYDGFTWNLMPDKILVISLSDKSSGRRLLKGLRRIELLRVK